MVVGQRREYISSEQDMEMSYIRRQQLCSSARTRIGENLQSLKSVLYVPVMLQQDLSQLLKPRWHHHGLKASA